jgi:prophage regulatory protein
MRLIRLPDVLERTSLKRSQLYTMMERGEFPRPIKLTARSNAWPESEVNDFIAAKIAARAAG